MVALKLGNKNVFSDGDTVYIIAEIGQNHQGNLNTAKEMISEAKVCMLLKYAQFTLILYHMDVCVIVHILQLYMF